MVDRNAQIAGLSANYLFPEIHRRKQEYLAQHPHAKIISLGIGDTSEPLPQVITDALTKSSMALGTADGYQGYGPDQGSEELRYAIVNTFYGSKVSPHDVFISDGIKCDIGRLQHLFGSDVSVAMQDPTYPVYLDGSLIEGVKNINLLRCTPENNFFPHLPGGKPPDIIYWCSPNNPTGTTSTREQLKGLVEFAKEHRSLIVFDAAYASYIRDETLPKSIYEIEGADTVAIELGSFSKLAGFSGVRLAWSVVPENVRYSDGSSVRADWKRVMSTLFNGASRLSQAGGIAALSPTGLSAIRATIQHYMDNVAIIKEPLVTQGYEVYGGVNAPYLWVRFPGQSSWEAFQHLLAAAQIITTPGSGFGPSGEGFLRLSAFGHRETIVEAAERLTKLLAQSR